MRPQGILRTEVCITRAEAQKAMCRVLGVPHKQYLFNTLCVSPPPSSPLPDTKPRSFLSKCCIFVSSDKSDTQNICTKFSRIVTSQPQVYRNLSAVKEIGHEKRMCHDVFDHYK
jgi:hypothetical protein